MFAVVIAVAVTTVVVVDDDVVVTYATNVADAIETAANAAGMRNAAEMG